MTLEEIYQDTIILQRILKIDGFYTGKVDGIHGPLTEAALTNWKLAAERVWFACPVPDERSERCLRSCSLMLQRIVRPWFVNTVMPWAEAAGYHAVRIICGTRSDAEQNNIPEACTNAAGGTSYHNYGLAVDIGIFGKSNKDYLGNNAPYIALKQACGVPAELIWGGTWKSPVDVEHYQIGRWGSTSKALRAFIRG